MEWKLRVTKGLYERGLPEEDIVELFRFIEWMMVLPEPLELQFDKEIESFEEEKKMPAITPFEQRAMSRGKKEGAVEAARESVLTNVQTHWGQVPHGVGAAVNRIDDMDRLRSLLREAITTGTLEEFERRLME